MLTSKFVCTYNTLKIGDRNEKEKKKESDGDFGH